MINKLKTFFRNHPLTCKLYKKLYRIKHFSEIKQKKRFIQLDGANTIIFIQKILEANNISFFFDMGTLLGIIREGKLLKHDMDIDVAVYNANGTVIESIKTVLIGNGCVHKHRYTTADIGIIEDSFVYKNIKFDICYYQQENNSDICFLAYNPINSTAEQFCTVKLSCEHIERIDKIIFNGYPINVPYSSERYLSQRYGVNWKIPDTNYIYWKGPSAQKISNITTKTTY